MGQIKAFIRRKILNTPIQNFTAKKRIYGKICKIYYEIEMDIDVYPVIKKIEQTDRKVPYRCKLSPLPNTKEISEIDFYDYERLHRNPVHRTSDLTALYL